MICENQTKKYCKDDFSKIENYEEAISDTTKTWHLHHRKETIYTRNGLIERGEYYDRPASELIFLPPSQHMALHGTLRQISEDTRKKLSKALLGKNANKVVGPDGTVYNSLGDASKASGLTKAQISKRIRGLNKDSEGWSYYNGIQTRKKNLA